MFVTSPELQPAADVFRVPVERIEPSPFQAREYFPEQELNELAEDIRERGLLQPILLRPHPRRDGWFQLVAGERRWRAHQIALLEHITATVRAMDDREAREAGLRENLQRGQLTDFEAAKGVVEMVRDYEKDGIPVSDREAARKIGKSVTFVRNCYDVLGLSDDLLEIARRRQNVKSALFLIDPIKDEPRREKYKMMVESGDGVRKIQSAIDRDEQEAKLSRVAGRAPDVQTQSRVVASARGENASMSRGERVVGPSRSEARQECARHMEALSKWLPHLSDEDFRKFAEPFARRILRGDLAR